LKSPAIDPPRRSGFSRPEAVRENPLAPIFRDGRGRRCRRVGDSCPGGMVERHAARVELDRLSAAAR